MGYYEDLQKVKEDALVIDRAQTMEADFKSVIDALTRNIVMLHEAQSPWNSSTDEEKTADARDILQLYSDINRNLEWLRDSLDDFHCLRAEAISEFSERLYKKCKDQEMVILKYKNFIGESIK